jgi:MATE family multidrug resistance protein
MVPLGISAAAAAHVGHAVGAGDKRGARASGYAALILALVFMTACAVVMLLVPDTLARLLTDQQTVIDAARPLIIIAAFFQVTDGLQVVCNGALRGMGDTRAVLYLNMAGHYVIGIPVGVALAFVAGWGASGLWWGLFAGLTVVAAALFVRFVRLSTRGVARLQH